MPIDSQKSGPLQVVALDLGSTRFKLGRADVAGCLIGVDVVRAPSLTGDGLIREGDPMAVLDAADGLLDGLDELPLGLVCQRSSFVIWDRHSGQALTPLVSWQDRRAAGWCLAHPEGEDPLIRRAGLLLSPHYVGPKLAAMQADDPELAARLRDGSAVFGNLDAWLAWHWTDGGVHRTDCTMAARTGLVDIASGDWSDELLDLFGVPRQALPEIVATVASPLALTNGLRLHASVADQASSALAVLDPDDDCALVNLGTGGFVLRPVSNASVRRRGLLTAPILRSGQLGNRYVLEGTINGAGPAVDRFGAGPSVLPAVDAWPDVFVIPDLSGIGAPHWRPEFSQPWSPAAEAVKVAADRRRLVIEGLLFRIKEILLGFAGSAGYGQLPARILLSGGLASEPAVAPGLASLLGQAVELFDEPESTLLGAARLAAGRPVYARLNTTRIEPSDTGAYLAEKFPRWQAWVSGVLGN